MTVRNRYLRRPAAEAWGLNIGIPTQVTVVPIPARCCSYTRSTHTRTVRGMGCILKRQFSGVDSGLSLYYIFSPHPHPGVEADGLSTLCVVFVWRVVPC